MYIIAAVGPATPIECILIFQEKDINAASKLLEK